MPSDNAPDQYEQYCNRPIEGMTINIMDWWLTEQRQSPQLGRMALDFMAVPAMPSECERVFSSAKLLLSDRRNRLKDDIIEANECLRAWTLKEI